MKLFEVIQLAATDTGVDEVSETQLLGIASRLADSISRELQPEPTPINYSPEPTLPIGDNLVSTMMDGIELLKEE